MKENKKIYVAPIANVVEFGSDDIVRTSNTTRVQIITSIFANDGVGEPGEAELLD